MTLLPNANIILLIFYNGLGEDSGLFRPSKRQITGIWPAGVLRARQLAAWVGFICFAFGRKLVIERLQTMGAAGQLSK